jgi:hypothetical protein
MGCVKPEYAHSLWIEFPVAEVSAITAGLVSYPIDTVRRQMMLQNVIRASMQQAPTAIKLAKYYVCWITFKWLL